MKRPTSTRRARPKVEAPARSRTAVVAYASAHPAGALELVARALAWTERPADLAIARTCLALAKAQRGGDVDALTAKGGPDSWARRYGSSYEATTTDETAMVRPSGGPLPRTMGAQKDRRRDRAACLADLVTWYRNERHPTNAERAFHASVWLVAYARVLGLPTHASGEAFEAAILAALETIPSGVPMPALATRRARATCRAAWGWTEDEVDAAFRNVV